MPRQFLVTCRLCILQRFTFHHSAPFAQPLKKVMTPKPICLSENALAVEALKIFNERNIDDLIVVNAKNEPVGLVDSQDLPKLKIV